MRSRISVPLIPGLVFVVALAACTAQLPASRAADPKPSAPTGQRVGDSLSVSKHRAELETLLRLTPERAARQPATTSDPRSIAARCEAQLGQAPTYGSLARVVDRSKPDLATHEYVALAWLFDHVQPDRYHAVQWAWNGHAYDYDEWISLGSSEFVWLGQWLEVEPTPGLPSRRELLKRLGLHKYAQVLRGEQPVSIDTYAYAGRRYYLLTYQLHAGAGDPDSFFTTLLQASNGSAQLALWVDAPSGLLAKAQFVPAAGVLFQFEQVFAGYSGDIRVVAPPTAPSIRK